MYIYIYTYQRTIYGGCVGVRRLIYAYTLSFWQALYFCIYNVAYTYQRTIYGGCVRVRRLIHAYYIAEHIAAAPSLCCKQMNEEDIYIYSKLNFLPGGKQVFWTPQQTTELGHGTHCGSPRDTALLHYIC